MNYLESFLAKFSDSPTDPPERTEETPREPSFLGFLSSPDEEKQKKQAAPLPRYWTAPNLSPADVEDVQAIRGLIWNGVSLTEILESGRRWNEAVRNRPGNPEREKPLKRSTGRPQWSAEDQESRESEREHDREASADGPDPEVAAFLEAARKKHEAYWAERPWPVREKSLFDREESSS